MPLDIIKRGTTSWRGARIFCFSSTTFLPKTDVVYNSAGIDLWYQREGGTRTAITEATLAATDSNYSSGGFIHVSDGWYRLDLPDAALASSAGVNFVDFGGTVTGGVFLTGRIKLVDVDFNDAVRAGLTALPNAAIDASNGIPDVVLDEVVEGSLTLRQILRILLSFAAGKTTGGNTTTPTFRDLADAKARISPTLDANNNRTAVTLDGT